MLKQCAYGMTYKLTIAMSINTFHILQAMHANCQLTTLGYETISAVCMHCSEVLLLLGA